MYRAPRSGSNVAIVTRRNTLPLTHTIVSAEQFFFTPQSTPDNRPYYYSLSQFPGTSFRPFLAAYSQYRVLKVIHTFRPMFNVALPFPSGTSITGSEPIPLFYYYIDRSVDSSVMQSPAAAPADNDDLLWPGASRAYKRVQFNKPVRVIIRLPNTAYPVPRAPINQPGGDPAPIEQQLWDYRTRRATWQNCDVLGDDGPTINTGVPHYGIKYGFLQHPPFVVNRTFSWVEEIEMTVAFRRSVL